MKIQVDFFKESGKWYAGGEVEVGDVRLWHGRDKLLDAVWACQEILCTGDDRARRQWTVVTRDTAANEADANFHEMNHAVLQVAQRAEP